jgi:hypothetical protein
VAIGDWGGRKIRERGTHADQTVKQCAMACLCGSLEFVSIMEVMIGGRERPAIEMIITFWRFLSITTTTKVGRESISQTSEIVRVSNKKFRLQLKKLKLES